MRLNGWSETEVQTLMRRTGRDRNLVERFCAAVDKRLYLMLDERQRRATLYFHLGLPHQAEHDDDRPPRPPGAPDRDT